jgi:hypothetical protein
MDNGKVAMSGTVIPAVLDGGQWAACFGLSWADMLLHDQAVSGHMIRPGGAFFREMAGTMGVAAGRNHAARFVLDTDAEWLFMVDSDMGFQPDIVDRLIESATFNGVGVLGALCFAQKRDPDLTQDELHAVRYRIQPTIYSYAEVASTGERGFRPVMKYQRDAFQEVAGTGAAAVLIHRSVLEAVGPDPFDQITDPNGSGKGMSRTFSEDLSFCIRVQGANLAIGVDTSIKTTHYKGGIYLDETSFAMQQETLIQAKGHAIARSAQAYLRAGLIVPGVNGWQG